MTPTEQTPEEIAEKITQLSQIKGGSARECSIDYLQLAIREAIRTEREKARVVWPLGVHIFHEVEKRYPTDDPMDPSDSFIAGVKWVREFVEGRAK